MANSDVFTTMLLRLKIVMSRYYCGKASHTADFTRVELISKLPPFPTPFEVVTTISAPVDIKISQYYNHSHVQ